MFIDASDGEVMSKSRVEMVSDAVNDSEAFEAIKPQLKLSNVTEPRMMLPQREEVKINLEMCWKLLKGLAGKDITKFSLPVFLNEPLSLSQKAAEMMFFNDLLDKATE